MCLWTHSKVIVLRCQESQTWQSIYLSGLPIVQKGDCTATMTDCECQQVRVSENAWKHIKSELNPTKHLLSQLRHNREESWEKTRGKTRQSKDTEGDGGRPLMKKGFLSLKICSSSREPSVVQPCKHQTKPLTMISHTARDGECVNVRHAWAAWIMSTKDKKKKKRGKKKIHTHTLSSSHDSYWPYSTWSS